MNGRPKFLHVGGVLYWTIRTRNPDTMVLKDADSTPTVAVRKNGASTGDSVTVTKRSATTGIYDCSYNPAGEVEGDEFTIEESATVTGTTTGSATYSNSWEFSVIAVERGTDSALTTLGTNAPANWINAASIASDSLTSIAAAVWNALTLGITVVGSIGKLLVDNINATISSRATQTSVDTGFTNITNLITALNNLSAKMNIFGAPLLEIPDSGSTVYAFTVVVKDDEDKLVNLDALPTLAAANAAGTNRSANLSAASNPSTGRYTFTYTVANTHANEPLRITVSGTVSAEARYIEWIGAVVDYDTLTTLQDVQSRIVNVQSRLPAALTANSKMDSEVTYWAGSTVSKDTEDYPAVSVVNYYESTLATWLKVDAIKSSIQTVVTKLSGITSLGDWIRRLARKDAGTAGMTTAQSEINTGGTATFNGQTDSLEATTDAVPKYGDSQHWDNGTNQLNVTVTKN